MIAFQHTSDLSFLNTVDKTIAMQPKLAYFQLEFKQHGNSYHIGN